MARLVQLGVSRHGTSEAPDVIPASDGGSCSQPDASGRESWDDGLSKRHLLALQLLTRFCSAEADFMFVGTSLAEFDLIPK